MKFYFALIVIFIANAYSAFVPLEKAKKVAENYYGHYCSEAASKGSSVINVLENKYEGLITRYTFEFDKGFVIVTADDGLYPILGYSDHGKVPKADQNGGQNFKEWFDNYDRQIACKGSGKYVDEAAVKLWKDIENNIFPAGKAGIVVDRLVKSQWGQLWPWNELCPLKDGKDTYVGCVATAMSQILRYHRWPDVGVGSASYSWNGQTLAANFATHYFNYDLMPEINGFEYGLYPVYWESGITQAEIDELAIQSYWTGLSVDMSYGTLEDNGSWAYAAPVDDAFLEHWKASSSVYYAMATPPAGGVDAQFATIKAELDAKRPWFWAGGVHAFVLDGYRDDYWYHFNWGWEGNYDGWFHRSSLIPGGVGSCDIGGGDFTAGQLGITYVPSTNTFAAWPATTLSGVLANGEDITLNWTACTGATGYEIYRTKDKAAAPTYLSTTTGLTFTENDLPEGEYAYHVIVIYATGESHNSNSFSATIVPVSTFPKVEYLTAVPVGRTSIDLTWVKPYTGVLWESTGWEGGSFGTWLLKISTILSSTVNNRSWSPDDGTRWFIENGTIMGDKYVHDGVFSAAISYNAGNGSLYPLSWLCSPSITFPAGSSGTWDFWIYYINNAESGLWPTDIYFYFYKGTFNPAVERTGIAIAANTVQLDFWDGSTFAGPDYGNNFYQSEVSLDLSSLAGQTGRMAFAYSYTNGYQCAVDDIIIGSPTGGTPEQTGYEIYRNGTLATTISGATNVSWSDTGFVDGDNTYYIKALYPTGTSIPSEHVIAAMDANPKPGYLTGTVLPATQANLNWYAPYHNAPKWYSYFLPENSITTIDILSDYTPAVKRRTLFKAEDLGFYYPVTLDSVAIGFYDWNESNWGGNNTFTIRILTGGTYAITDTVYTSSVCTAVHGQIYYHKLPTPMVLSEPWNVEITTNSTGYPGTLAAPATGTSTHSYFEYDGGSGPSYYYYMEADGNKFEWLHMSYVTSSAPPPIAKIKSGWLAPDINVSEKGMAFANIRKLSSPLTALKALDYYKIYRNGVQIGTSLTTNYADSGVPYSSNYKYSVTARYSSPVGESSPSNEIELYVLSFPPPLPQLIVTTTLIEGNFFINWNVIPDATSYNVYASENPYGIFTLLANVPVSEYTYTQVGTHPKMFFCITVVIESKDPPKTIEIPKKVK